MRSTHKTGHSLRGHKASGGRVRAKQPKRAKRYHGRA